MLFLRKMVQFPQLSHRFSPKLADHGDHGSGQEHLSPDDLGFVVAAVARRANEMAMHVYGCRIIQRRNGPGDEPGKTCVMM